ncbi:acetyltransferase [Haematobacter missouriensis]|uniref:N-acetyltransferase n=1 Tax=Haematobacter missouriensis TaxID=366616 RepID=A0A212ATQ0_9RHOB|nr:GNAT family N-acetyltransferase [Haematobacter missouriensis]KFI26101.1 acetyltransferase [Haematobacter missouriensis]OWJ78036.1 N-acetyltransferase [Haematobacter missouriensis]OWJ84756.1 N-acetyltransferase [Haematobacter missouriensis]
MILREASPADLPRLAEIYNDILATTDAIWNDAPVDAENRAQWLAARRTQGYPVLVAEEEGRVLGYASFGDFRPFSGYRLTVEHSVHLAAEARGRGVGRVLMQALIEAAREAGKHVMVGAIGASNAASIALHEKLGFTHVGMMPEVGVRQGRWLDLVLMQLRLDAAPAKDR